MPSANLDGRIPASITRIGFIPISVEFMPITPTDTYDFLIEPEELCGTGSDTVIVDTRSPEAYESGHIPGALNYCSYDRFVRSTSPIGLSRFAREQAKDYGSVGISESSPIFICEETTGMRAAREHWILCYLGHRNARILNGGLQGWVQGGGALTTEEPESDPVTFVTDPQ